MIATALNFWKRLLKYLHLLLRSEDLCGTHDTRDWNHSSHDLVQIRKDFLKSKKNAKYPNMHKI